jgi:hypothetical protein
MLGRRLAWLLAARAVARAPAPGLIWSSCASALKLGHRLRPWCGLTQERTALRGIGGLGPLMVALAVNFAGAVRDAGWRRAEIVPHSGTPARGKSAIAKIAAIKSL